MTGENFLRIERRNKARELRAKIIELEHRCGEMCNVNAILENGFDGVEYDRICKKLEWLKYLLWGEEEK